MVSWNDMVEWNIGKLDTHSIGLWEKGYYGEGNGWANFDKISKNMVTG